MAKANSLICGYSGLKPFSLPSFVKGVRAFFPVGGSLPADVWRKRHRFLLSLTWFHAALIALVGPALGYTWEFSIKALFEEGTVLHSFGEASAVGFFAAVATWGTKRRLIQATSIGLGLMSASAILVHLSGGYIELHFHFFVMVAFLALYQDWVPYLLAIVYVAIHHGLVGVIWPYGVYNHAAAISAPWTWAGIHAFFVLWAAAGSIIAWRFNEKAAAQTKLILESAGEGIFGLDLEGKITFINPAAANMMDVDKELVVGKSIEGDQRSTAGVDREAFLSTILAPFKDPIAHRASGLKLYRADGRVFPADVAATPVIERGEMTGVVVTFSDVTKHKQAEEAIAKKVKELAHANAEARARAKEQEALNIVAKAISQSLRRDELLEIALGKVQEVTGRERVSIRLTDPLTGEVKLVAHRGFSRAEIENLLQIVRHQATEQVMASGQPLVIDNARSHSDGALRLLPQSRSVAWIPMKAGAKIVGILGISASSPVSFPEREVEFLQSIGSMLGVALENARLFSETEARYQEFQTLHKISRAILDSFDVKVMMERILEQAIEIGRFDIGLIRLLDTKGESLEPVVSRGYRDANNVRSHRTKIDGYTSGAGTSRVIDDKKVHVVDLTQTSGMRTFRKEGVCKLVAIPLRRHEDVLGVIQLGSRTAREFRDTELRILEAIGGQAGIAIQKARLYEETRRAQEALAEKAEELARSNTELQHFAYVASHDLQEPLRMVASYVQLLARRYKGELDSEADEFIGFAVDGATRMQALINALLDYSRIGTKGKPFEPTDCEKILQVALKNLQLAVEENRAIVTHDSLPTVMGDATQLGQLFQNLIGNAIKFRGDKPPEVHVSAERNGKDWHFFFRDNGIGIDPKFSERIFVIFQRLHSKGEYPGTGIGLALCKKIVERHGGRIWVESEPGKGATFRFTIPHELFSFFKEVTASHV